MEEISKEVDPLSEDKWTIKIGGNLLGVSLYPMKKKQRFSVKNNETNKQTQSSHSVRQVNDKTSDKKQGTDQSDLSAEELNTKIAPSTEDLTTMSASSIKNPSIGPSPSSEKQVTSDENTVKDSNRAIGLDFTIPTGLLEEQTRTMVEFILTLASKWNMMAFDPQLGRTVHLSDSEIIVAHWRAQNDFILTTVGSNGSTVGGGAFYPEYEKGLSPGAKFWLFAGGFVLILLLFIRYCV